MTPTLTSTLQQGNPQPILFPTIKLTIILSLTSLGSTHCQEQWVQQKCHTYLFTWICLQHNTMWPYDVTYRHLPHGTYSVIITSQIPNYGVSSPWYNVSCPRGKFLKLPVELKRITYSIDAKLILTRRFWHLVSQKLASCIDLPSWLHDIYIGMPLSATFPLPWWVLCRGSMN